MTDGQKEEVATKVTAAVTFMEGVKADRAAKELHQDPIYNLDGIILTLETLKKETTTIFDRPPPKPEVPVADETMKDEAKPAEGEAKPDEAEAAAPEDKKEGDAEMKNEEGKEGK